VKILCVIDNLGSGGAQRQLVEIALCLKDLGFHMQFLTYQPESFYYSSLINKGIAIKCINSKIIFERQKFKVFRLFIEIHETKS
jgi:hypothetical protein